MEIIKIADVGLETAARKAADVLERGGLIVYPTDTLYGIGVNAASPEALARMRELKVRDDKKPVSILAASTGAIERDAVLTERAKELAARILPGALTLVLPAREHLGTAVTQHGTVGVRVPADPFALALAAMTSFPVTATSANIAGMATPATVPEILMHFGPAIRHIELFIDDGPRAGGVPSTVVRATDDGLHILREGAISREDLGL